MDVASTVFWLADLAFASVKAASSWRCCSTFSGVGIKVVVGGVVGVVGGGDNTSSIIIVRYL